MQSLNSPTAYLKQRGVESPLMPTLEAFEAWWEREGKDTSASVDRAGTPWVRMYDRQGNRVDEVLFPPGYRTMLLRGYQEGIVSRAIESNSLMPFYLLAYVTAFYDPGVLCPYTVSLSTAVPLEKYGANGLKERFLPALLRQDETVWQGATWMTEIRGGSDLGAGVETLARNCGDYWLLNGDKYFASNAGAELAVVAARPEGAPAGVRGLALFLLPKFRRDGRLNYTIRRLKDKIATRSVPTGEVELRESEAFLLGQADWGVYLILEVLNLSRVANSVGSVALAQRALAEAWQFANQRNAFGKPIVQHPLLKKQFDDRIADLNAAFALAWETTTMLDAVWRDKPPYSPRYHLFRLLAHLAKYWTAEFAAQTAKWAMEVHGGLGTLQEYPVERWLREAMILAIWEGTSHRQMLDALEVMERKDAHHALFQHLAPIADPHALEEIAGRVDDLLALPRDAKEAGAEEVFAALARFAAETLARKR